MKRVAFIAFILLLAAGAFWLYIRRETFRLQWACYQVTSAANYEDFRQRMEDFQRDEKDHNRFALLAARWKTGNAAFDEHFVRYLSDPQCDEGFREAFSRELGWRPELIAAWAETWREQKPDANDEIASLRRYLEAIYSAQPSRTLTWRDILDMQAALQLTGRGKLAHRLTPDNWRGRYEQWRNADARTD